jgi:hypothetical protein
VVAQHHHLGTQMPSGGVHTINAGRKSNAANTLFLSFT